MLPLATTLCSNMLPPRLSNSASTLPYLLSVTPCAATCCRHACPTLHQFSILLPANPTQQRAASAPVQLCTHFSNRCPLPLCSNVLPPRLSNIAFIGQHATFAHVLTASLESRWLAGVLSGQVKLPPKEAQLEDIARQQASCGDLLTGGCVAFNQGSQLMTAQAAPVICCDTFREPPEGHISSFAAAYKCGAANLLCAGLVGAHLLPAQQQLRVGAARQVPRPVGQGSEGQRPRLLSPQPGGSTLLTLYCVMLLSGGCLVDGAATPAAAAAASAAWHHKRRPQALLCPLRLLFPLRPYCSCPPAP